MARVGQRRVRALTQMLSHINRLLVGTVGFGHVILATSHDAARVGSSLAAATVTTSVVFGEHLIEEVRVVEVDQVRLSCVHGVLPGRLTGVRLATILVLGVRASLHLAGLPRADLRACVVGGTA